LLLTSLLAAASADGEYQPFMYSVDINQQGNASTFSCLRSNQYGVVIIRAYKPNERGEVDGNAIDNIHLAYNANLGVEVYMSPNPTSSKTGATQVDEMLTALRNGGITVRAMWIQVISPYIWYQNTTDNLNFVNSALNRIRARGVRPGVYTNKDDWQWITNDASQLGTDVWLWYFNVNDAGVAGETAPNFDDFRKFGNWNGAAVKQFGQNEDVCGLTVNRDVYPASDLEIF
ncbi:hypothetical protein PFISCL1PPCAC_11716, partial [Pristionchus fissidentatus]